MMDIKPALYGDGHAPHSAYESYTPVSLSGRSSPVGSQRLGSVDYSTSGSFSMPLDMTPPHSATTPFFPMNMPGAAASAAPLSASVDALAYNMSSSMSSNMSSNMSSMSSFASQPTTPERNASFSSHESYGSPISPVGHMLTTSYPPSIASAGSTASLASMAPATPDGYPFPDMHAKSAGMATQQPLPNPYHHQPQHAPQHHHVHAQQPQAAYGAYPAPPAAFDQDPSDLSPSKFYWHNRPDSPAINYFGDRQSLPPPPAAVTLKSSVVKTASESDGYLTPGSESVYGSPSSRRALSYSSAQMSAKALQDAVTTQIAHNNAYAHAHGHAHLHPIDGTIVRRNGIEVARIASGAYKCVVPGCPSRPFKRSEHLKRHVTTHHENKDQYNCQFCGRQFNRKDNWRSHLKLHTAPRGKNARTDYFPAAVTLYTEEMRKVTKSRARKESMTSGRLH